MKYFADLHIHSHYSRATSKDLDLEHLHLWAQKKGIQVVATGDFVHPNWMEELKEKLIPAEEGFFKLKPEYEKQTANEVPKACQQPVRFMLSVEISNIYKRLEKVRKVHNIVCVPSFEAAEKLQSRLDKIGNIRSDGRPILGLDSRDLLEIVLETDPLSYLIPAHIWTPWFAMLGSKGGFDSVEDCFGDLTPEIFAVETGLSSDPAMNWRLSQLDPYVMVSNSDAHSPSKLGREANILETEFSYRGIYEALKNPENTGLKGTLEFFPAEGKYHFDGHRKCQTRLHPQETIKLNGLCPVCGNPVTVGVLARVEELADREEGVKAPRARPFYSLIPLPEIIGEALNIGSQSKKVQKEYHELLAELGDEFTLLFDTPIEEIQRVGGELVAEGVKRMREGNIQILGGYDGEYGKIQIFSEKERQEQQGQSGLFEVEDFPEDSTSTEMEEPVLDATIEETFSDENELEESLSIQEKIRQKKANLNEAQKEAVHSEDSHLLIIAGPGTGKTYTLVHRILQKYQKLKPKEKILAITFTNKAAEEMRERIESLNSSALEQIVLGTFHQFCVQLLRQYRSYLAMDLDFRIAAETDCYTVAQLAWPGKTNAECKKLLAELSLAKSSFERYQQISEELQTYQKLLRRNGFFDFDDLLLEMVQLLRYNELIRIEICFVFRNIFIDEYQDINEIQLELLKLLHEPETSLTAIGDPNQAIYGFRGANAKLFSQFSQNFSPAMILWLKENYRTSGNILTAASQVIQNNTGEKVPSLIPKITNEGSLTVFGANSDKGEAEYIVHQIEQLVGGTSMFSQDSGRVEAGQEANYSFSDFAVLYRLNRQRPVLEEAFERMGIPYQVSGTLPFRKQHLVGLVLTLLRFSRGESVLVPKMLKILEELSSNFGIKSSEKIQKHFEQKQKETLSLLDLNALSRNKELFSEKVLIGLTSISQILKEVTKSLKQDPLEVTLSLLLKVENIEKKISENIQTEGVWKVLFERAKSTNSLPAFLDDVLLQKEQDTYERKVERVSLFTLHAAKGLEFPVVFISGCEASLLPLDLEPFTSDLEEERRLFYVGMTRAKSMLYLTYAKNRTWFGKLLEREPSPFLNEIDEELKQNDVLRKPKTKKEKNPSQQLNLFD